MIFNCKILADKIIERIDLSGLSLAVIQIGDDPASELFIRKKKKAMESAGGSFNLYRFPETVGFEELEERIKKMNEEGLIVQLPINGNLKTQEVLNLIPFQKDIDVLTELSLGKFYTGNLEILPPVVGAVDLVLKENQLELSGKTVAVVGPGRLVGKPMIIYSILKGATVISIGKETKNPGRLIREADVVVSGVGIPELIKASDVKKGAFVLDAGVAEKNNKVMGDVATEEVAEKAIVTPVPGGIGPLTVSLLLENLRKRYES